MKDRIGDIFIHNDDRKLEKPYRVIECNAETGMYKAILYTYEGERSGTVVEFHHTDNSYTLLRKGYTKEQK